jgi:malonyl-CoA O-methyltransferase
MATPSDQRPPTIDPVAAQRWLRKAPPQSPWLHEEVGNRMQERLEWIKLQPASWMDWDAVGGGLEAHRRVAQRYPGAVAHVNAQNPARDAAARDALRPAWWSPRRWRAGAVRFGAPGRDVQMLWANMALHMAADPQDLIGQWQQQVAVGGFLMFSCLGPDTLRELRAVYADLGWPAPAHEFTDMHDWGDMLVHAGFAEPVMDMERIVLTYQTPAALLDELRGLGRNLHPGRFIGLRGRGWRARLEQALTARLADPAQDGRLALTFEIIYGHAFKPQPKVQLAAESAVSLDAMRSMLREGRNTPSRPR